MLNVFSHPPDPFYREFKKSKTPPPNLKARHFRFRGNGGPPWPNDSRRLGDFVDRLERALPFQGFSGWAPDAAIARAPLVRRWDRLRWIAGLLVRGRCRPGGYMPARSPFFGCSYIFAASAGLANCRFPPSSHPGCGVFPLLRASSFSLSYSQET